MARNSYQAETGVVSFGSARVDHEPVVLDFPDDGKTKQEFAPECDINTIMARYAKTGTVPTYGGTMFYGDFVDLPSFQEAHEIIRVANEAFAALPATVRREFDNDPGEFVRFAEDPANLGKLREWGLARPLDPPQAVEPASAGDRTSGAPAAAGAVSGSDGGSTQVSS